MLNEHISGCISGSVANLVTYPIDTLKVLKQNNIPYKFNYLYKGVLSPTITIGLLNSILFSSNLNIYKKTNNHYISGSISGLINAIISNPIEYRKLCYQTGNKYSNKYIYRGFFATSLRDSIGTSIYFGSYYDIKPKTTSFIAGGVSGVLSWIITYPIDVIKSRYQPNINIKYIDAYRVGNLWVGFTFCCLRSFLNNAIIFYTFDELINNK